MYKGFNINIDKSMFESNKRYEEYKQIGEEMIKEFNEEAEELIDKFLKDGIIDGTNLQDSWFKTIKADVFISHSHNDRDELVYPFAGWLQSKFGLKVFLDTGIWGSADKLLREIDNIYCRNQKTNTYRYEDRNYSTSHVHTMLTVAIMKIIDSCEITIFLNTEQSIPIIKEVVEQKEQYTLSPWIYEELVLAHLIRSRHWSEHRDYSLLEFVDGQKSINNALKIKYKVPINELTNLNKELLIKWEDRYNKQNASDGAQCRGIGILAEEKHPLNCLYEIAFGKQQ